MHRLFFLLLLAIGGFIACDSGSQPVNAVSYEPTQGIITEVQEVDTNEFRIIDERVVPTPEESRIIAHYIDGTSDTLTVEDAKMIGADGLSESEDNSTHRRNYYGGGGYGFYSVLRGGLMGYYLGRSMSVPPTAGVYMDNRTYNRVADNAGRSMQQTARRTTVNRPRNSSSGYGARRSTRSYGG